MTTENVLRLLRRQIAEVDESLSDYTDEELLAAIHDARDLLEIQKITGFDALAVGYDQTDPSWGIIPDPTLMQGWILAGRAAVDLLRQVYVDKVKRGELGGSWQSGLEAESTINTQRAYKDSIDELDAAVEGLVLIVMVPQTGTRPQ